MELTAELTEALCLGLAQPLLRLQLSAEAGAGVAGVPGTAVGPPASADTVRELISATAGASSVLLLQFCAWAQERHRYRHDDCCLRAQQPCSTLLLRCCMRSRTAILIEIRSTAFTSPHVGMSAMPCRSRIYVGGKSDGLSVAGGAAPDAVAGGPADRGLLS